MTKREYEKCVKVMHEGIRAGEVAKEDYYDYEHYGEGGRPLLKETYLRSGDQHFGEAQGINQVLVTLGFDHPDMKKLTKLI